MLSASIQPPTQSQTDREQSLHHPSPRMLLPSCQLMISPSAKHAIVIDNDIKMRSELNSGGATVRKGPC